MISKEALRQLYGEYRKYYRNRFRGIDSHLNLFMEWVTLEYGKQVMDNIITMHGSVAWIVEYRMQVHKSWSEYAYTQIGMFNNGGIVVGFYCNCTYWMQETCGWHGTCYTPPPPDDDFPF